MRGCTTIWRVCLCLALPACSMDWTLRLDDVDDAGDVGEDVELDVDGDAVPPDWAGDADAETAPDVDGDDVAGPDAGADVDVGADGDADTDGDADDAPGPDADADAGGLVLHAAGMATVAAEGLTAGAMRLTEVGFEGGYRSCAGSLCLWVGVVP